MKVVADLKVKGKPFGLDLSRRSPASTLHFHGWQRIRLIVPLLKIHYLIVVIVSMLLPACQEQPASDLDLRESHYFGETEHTVQGDFWRFFNHYGGTESLGYPLTEELVVDGWTVQYFEKGRLEYHPENKPAYRITVGWLGDLLQRRRPPLPAALIPPAGHPNRRYYPETGHTISGDFLRYFEAHGGTVRFGLPISEPFLREGRLTQDFQSARFFWMPAVEPPVILEEIGRVYLKLIEPGPNSWSSEAD